MRIDPYHFYCQKVLPAVYDESLSYYEDVCKLLAAMQELDKSMDDLEKRMDALDQISTVLWPQFQAEVNATLQQYAKAYEDFQAGIETDISGFEAQLTAMNTTLTNAINSQNETIAANNVAQMAMLTQRLAAQDEEIESISNTVEHNSQDMADLTADVHNFIAQYSPPATINGLSPQFLIAANAGASLTAVQGLIQLTATADSEGNAVINASNYGNWTVTSLYQGQTKSVTVTVDDVKQYSVDVAQQEKTYTFVLNPIPNFADLPSIITHSMFQITGPNGYSITKPVQAAAQSFSVPGPGEYSFDLKIANIYPDTSSATGYKAASASGAVIYTSTPGGPVTVTMPNSSVNNSSTVTSLGLPYFEITLPDDKQITVTSPVTATDVAQTMTAESTTYKFIPWAVGSWGLSSTAASDSSSLTTSVWNAPTSIPISLISYAVNFSVLGRPSYYLAMDDWHIEWTQGSYGGSQNLTANGKCSFNVSSSTPISVSLYGIAAITNNSQRHDFSEGTDFLVDTTTLTLTNDTFSGSITVPFIQVLYNSGFTMTLTRGTDTPFTMSTNAPICFWAWDSQNWQFEVQQHYKKFLSLQGVNKTISLQKMPAYQAGQQVTLSFPYTENTDDIAPPVTANEIATVANNANDLYSKVGFNLCGLYLDGTLAGPITHKSDAAYVFEDGSVFVGNKQYLAIYIPAHTMTMQFGLNSLNMTLTPTNSIGDNIESTTRDFNGVAHKAIAITINMYNPDNATFPSSGYTHTVINSPTDNNNVPFGEIIRFDQTCMMYAPLCSALNGKVVHVDANRDSSDLTTPCHFFTSPTIAIRPYNYKSEKSLGTLSSLRLINNTTVTIPAKSYTSEESVKIFRNNANSPLNNSVGAIFAGQNASHKYYLGEYSPSVTSKSPFLSFDYGESVKSTQRIVLSSGSNNNFRLVSYID